MRSYTLHELRSQHVSINSIVLPQNGVIEKLVGFQSDSPKTRTFEEVVRDVETSDDALSVETKASKNADVIHVPSFGMRNSLKAYPGTWLISSNNATVKCPYPPFHSLSVERYQLRYHNA